MHVAECFFFEGEHYGAPDCYHNTVVEPEEMQPGWTVQTPLKRNASYSKED
jgi:hypothetical protein